MQHPSRAWQKMARIKLLWKKHFSYVSLAQCGNYQMSTLSWILTYEGHMREVGIVDNFFEKFQRFMHSIDTSIFAQNLIILGHGNHEENTIHIVKTVNPFLAFWTLASNVKHVKNQTFVFEFNLKTWQIPIKDKEYFSFLKSLRFGHLQNNQCFAKVPQLLHIIMAILLDKVHIKWNFTAILASSCNFSNISSPLKCLTHFKTW